jgi:hypothetical protein
MKVKAFIILVASSYNIPILHGFTHDGHFIIPPFDEIMTRETFLPRLFNHVGKASFYSHPSLKLNLC